MVKGLVKGSVCVSMVKGLVKGSVCVPMVKGLVQCHRKKCVTIVLHCEYNLSFQVEFIMLLSYVFVVVVVCVKEVCLYN